MAAPRRWSRARRLLVWALALLAAWVLIGAAVHYAREAHPPPAVRRPVA